MTAQGQPEKRLLFVRNLDAFDATSQRTGKAYEFEVVADVPAYGSAQIGPIWLRPWDYAESLSGRRHSMVLSITNLLPEQAGAPTNEGFFHGSGPPGEICAFASVVLRRRIYLGPVIRVRDVPMRLPERSAEQSPQLVEGRIDLGQLPPMIAMVRRLHDDIHEPFLLASRMYQEGLELLDSKPDIAYLLFVSAVEVFLARLGRRTTEADLSDDIKTALKLISETSARQRLTERILDLDRGIQKHFVKFILEHVTQAFWDASPKCSPAEGRIESAELEPLLYRVYDQRSRMVHAGEPFPPNIENPPKSVAEIDRCVEVTALGRRWKRADFLPYVRFFERLVQHVLITFLEIQADAGALSR